MAPNLWRGHSAGFRERCGQLPLRYCRPGGGVPNLVPERRRLRGVDHRRRQVRDVGKRVGLVRAADDPKFLPGQDRRNHALAAVGVPDARAEKVAGNHADGVGGRGGPGPEQLGADPALAALCGPRPRLGHRAVRLAVGVKAFREDDDGARLGRRGQHRLFGPGEFRPPGVRRVRGAVDAVEDGGGASESVPHLAGVLDIGGQPLHQRMLGAAA